MLAVGAGGGCFGHFFSPFISLFFLPLSGRRRETLSQRAVKCITINQPIINGKAFSVSLEGLLIYHIWPHGRLGFC